MVPPVKFFWLLLFLTLANCDNFRLHNPTLDSYNDYFSRGAKNPGFWGAVAPSNANVFDNKWNSKGYQQMYNLNSQSPMAGARATGFDTTTTMFNKYGPTSFEVIPVQSNFMPQSRINAYTYDLNEPRMQAIYKNYMRMMNKNLDRITNIAKDNTDFGDLNDSARKKLENPSAYQYKKQYFDGLDQAHTAPAYYGDRFIPIPQKSSVERSANNHGRRERRLVERPIRERRLENINKIRRNNGTRYNYIRKSSHSNSTKS